VNKLVVNREESMPVEHLFVPIASGVHLSLGVVSDDVIEVEELGDGHETVERLGGGVGLVAWQENAVIVLALHKSVDSISESSN